jgi:hypothetical protein
VTLTSTTIPPTTAQPKERILFEARPMMLPAILNFENLALIGIIMVAALAFVVFHMGVEELIAIGVIWALLAFPAFRNVFNSGSTTYVLTNKRLMIFTVNIRNSEQSIPLEEIQSATCKFSGLQLFYGAGDIIVQRKGFKRTVRLRALPQVRDYAKQITNAVKTVKA